MTYGNYPSPAQLARVKKILVIKLRNLGDVLLTTPLFAPLHHAMPQAKIDFLVYEEAREIVEGIPFLSKIFGHDRGGKKLPLFSRLYREVKLFLALKREKYDMVIHLTEGDRGALIARMSGASIRVGYQGKAFTHLMKKTPTLRHTVERNLDALRILGISQEAGPLLFSVPQEAAAFAATLAPYTLIHPTSRWRFKCLPVATMRGLVEALLLEGKRVVLTSGPDEAEKEMVRQIAEGFDVINLSGKISLKELGALVQRAELLYTVDSLPFHLASAFQTPVVAAFGPTSEVTWGPYLNPYAKVVTSPFSCRPCYQDGCGGSKRSECLIKIPVLHLLDAGRALLSPLRLCASALK